MSKVAKSKGPAKVAAKRKGGKYQMPEPLPNGEILTDLTKKQWKLGPSIGKGGFGEIYSATEVSTPGKNSYVIKIEPKENGPLFVEMHFFMKVCKSEDIEKWTSSKKLSFLGLPRFVGNGSHMHDGKHYRFVVMERLGKNLDIVIKENNVLSARFIYQIALQIIDTLEYIHHKGYVHADVKGGNLLLGLKKGTEDKVYLVDFGLASKYSSDFKLDPKSAHNGTIEFTSRDAHVGATTRRGDLEILAYNMLRWFTSRLPWEDKLSDCTYVQQQKIKYMSDVSGLMQKCFGSQPVPEALNKYFQYVSQMAPTSCPDYDRCRSLFQEGLKATETPSGRKGQTASPKRTVKPSAQNSKKLKNDNKLEGQKVEKNRKSPVKVTNIEKLSMEDVVDSKPSRPVRAVRKVNNVVNGYFSESDSNSDESDVVYSPPKTVSVQRKGVKRRSDDEVFSPKRKY